jgi:hypothetical protein
MPVSSYIGLGSFPDRWGWWTQTPGLTDSAMQPGYNKYILLYCKHLFWRMAQSDWWLKGQDFPYCPQAIPNFYCPVRKTVTKNFKIKWNFIFLKEKLLKWATRSILKASFITDRLKISLTKYSVIICFIPVCRWSSIRNTHVPYNKKCTDFNCSGCTGKYPRQSASYCCSWTIISYIENLQDSLYIL